MFNFLNEAHGSFNLEEKDYKRMLALWDKRSNGAGVASKITDPGKAAARYIAGLIVTGKKLPNRLVFDNISSFQSDLDWQDNFGWFWAFAKTAINLGATYDTLSMLYNNSKNPEITSSSKLLSDLDDEITFGKSQRSIKNIVGHILNDEELELQKKMMEDARSIKNTVLWFNNLSAAFLFNWEESGQISDGKYENSKPFGHWVWLNNYKTYVNKQYNPFSYRIYKSYKGNINWRASDSPKRYNINDKMMFDACGDEMMCYGRFGKAVSNTQLSYDRYANPGNGAGDFRTICARLGDTKRFDKVDDFLYDIQKNHSWVKIDHWLTAFKQEDYDRYYQIKYTIKDLKDDLHAMDATINNFKVLSGYCY